MKGYDEHGNLLLPPRLAGEELPPELLQYYQDHEERNEMSKNKPETDANNVEGGFITSINVLIEN